jgi:hypothetical protein
LQLKATLKRMMQSIAIVVEDVGQIAMLLAMVKDPSGYRLQN